MNWTSAKVDLDPGVFSMILEGEVSGEDALVAVDDFT